MTDKTEYKINFDDLDEDHPFKIFDQTEPQNKITFGYHTTLKIPYVEVMIRNGMTKQYIQIYQDDKAFETFAKKIINFYKIKRKQDRLVKKTQKAINKSGLIGNVNKKKELEK